MDQNLPEELLIEAKAYYESGYDSEEVVRMLCAKGIGENQAKEALARAKKIIFEKRRRRGLLLLGCGALCLFSGFLISAILFHSNASPAIPLYGLTSAGIIFLLFGMADCLGL